MEVIEIECFAVGVVWPPLRACTSGERARLPTVFVLGVWADALVEQQLDHGLVPLLCRKRQRRSSISILGVWLDVALGEQQPCYRLMPSLCCARYRRPSSSLKSGSTLPVASNSFTTASCSPCCVLQWCLLRAADRYA
jgi:hypothetical protein